MTNCEKPIDPTQLSFADIFMMQTATQEKMLACGMYDDFKSEGTNAVPADDIRLMSYHIQHLMSEIGEVLDADKRWKNSRNHKYDKAAKLKEIADCFIVLMNVSMFSGFDGGEIAQAIIQKVLEVQGRNFEK